MHCGAAVWLRVSCTCLDYAYSSRLTFSEHQGIKKLRRWILLLNAFDFSNKSARLMKLQVAVATNPTHYGNPSSGCESDEQAVKVQGLSGDFCSPKCDSTGSCPSDVPKGDTATPECALRTTTGDKYCALICQSDSDCGSQVAFQMCVLKSMNERQRSLHTDFFLALRQ